jgi:peptidyl-prolyl cis-trans isomerase D
MLNAFRSRGVTSVVYGVMIVATILVFVLGFNPSAGKKTAPLTEQCAARVRGWCITPQDHTAAFRILIPRGPQGELETQKAKQMGLMKVALDGLIERELLVGEAERMGISVTDDEVTDEIYGGFIRVSVPSDNPGLALSLNIMDPSGSTKVYADFRDQKSKRFDLKVYERSIKAHVGRSPTEFREEQTRELLAAKVRDLVRTPVRVSEVEALESYVDEKSTATLTYVQIRQSWVAKYAVPISAPEVDAWAKKAENQGLVDAAMKERSGNHIRHVLAKFGGSPPTAGDKQAAKEKIQRALIRLKAGEPFATVAKEMSEDSSANSGGDLGEKTDSFVPAFKDAADKLKPGEMTQEPIETEFGYHIIKKDAGKSDAALAEQRRETTRELYAKTKALDAAKALADGVLVALQSGKGADDAVKDTLAPIVAAYAATHRAPLAEHRPTLARTGDGPDAGARSGDASSDAAASTPPSPTDTPDTDPTRPQVITTSPFNKGGDPIPTLPFDSTTQVMKFAFAGKTKDGEVFGEPLKADDGFIVAMLKQHVIATKEEFEKDRETYLAKLVTRKQAEALSLYVKRIKEQAKGAIKVDEKYMAERVGSKDGGAAAPGEDEDEGP